MTKAAFDKIAEGLREAGAYAEADAMPKKVISSRVLSVKTNFDTERRVFITRMECEFVVEPVVEDMPEPTGTVQQQAFRALTEKPE